LITWGGSSHIDECVDAYSKAVEIDPKDGSARFRLGVALRMRFDSDHRRAHDFQAAAQAWSSSLSLDPNQYIRRRRIEQYGPRLSKPYPFYDWVDQARREVAARGERPIELAVEPYGSEIAAPSRALAKSRPLEIDPDPKGKIARDRDELVTIEVAVVPARIRPGGAARVHLILRPNRSKGAHWNNESTPSRLFIDPAGRVDVSATTLEAPQPNIAESDEERRFDFEVQLAADASGTIDLPAHVLFNACESTGGRCLYRRKDLRIRLVVK
jgi:tetratricopeptide (TPR) repeat protein